MKQNACGGEKTGEVCWRHTRNKFSQATFEKHPDTPMHARSVSLDFIISLLRDSYCCSAALYNNAGMACLFYFKIQTSYYKILGQPGATLGNPLGGVCERSQCAVTVVQDSV